MRQKSITIVIAGSLAIALAGCTQHGGSGSNGADRSTPDQQTSKTGGGNNPSTPAQGSPDASGGISGNSEDRSRPGSTRSADRTQSNKDPGVADGTGANGSRSTNRNPHGSGSGSNR